MPRDRRGPAAIAGMILSAQLFAAAGVPEAKRDVESARISEALCGRANEESVRAEALDAIDGEKVPDVWQKSRLSDLALWLAAPQCDATKGTKLAETSKFLRRHNILAALGERLDRAHLFDDWEAMLMPLPRWHPVHDTWPSDAQCAGCLQLRHAASVLDKAASDWPKASDSADELIGRRLDNIRKRESLIRNICTARPPAGARREIETRFKYYTWTSNGAKLLTVAQWFERLEKISVCSTP